MFLNFPYKSVIKTTIVSIAFLSSYLAAYSNKDFYIDSLEVKFNESLYEIDSSFEMNIITSDEEEINNTQSPPPSNCQNVERIPIIYDGNLEKDIEKELIYPKLPVGSESKEYKTVVTIHIDNNGKQIPYKSYIFRSSGIKLLDKEALRVANTLHNWKPITTATKVNLLIFLQLQ